MKVWDRYGLLPAILNIMLLFSGFLAPGYLLMDAISSFCRSAIVIGCCLCIDFIDLILVKGTAAAVWLTRSSGWERNGRTGVLPLADDGSGCGDIGREYCEAWWGWCSWIIRWSLCCVCDTDRRWYARWLVFHINCFCWIKYCLKCNLSRLKFAVTALLSLNDLPLVAARSPSGVALTYPTSSWSTAFAIVNT